MSSLLTRRISNTPFLIAGSALFAFALTNYHFNKTELNPALDFICRLLSVPVLFVNSVLHNTNLETLMGSIPFVFCLFFFFYSTLLILANRYIRNRIRLTRHS
ncbi:MAG: hypothetical protein JNL47_04275 [Bacteroidia bacterium]|nr:hypothetical protein [Bacteroidia bacterium]